MKKTIFWTAITAIIVGLIAAFAYTKMYDEEETPATVQVGNTTVETLIAEDSKYFDNMAGDIIFYESQVALDKPFNEGDHLVAVEVTNIFQQNLEKTCNVYEFKHFINCTETDVQVHTNTSWFEDCPVDIDTLKLTFNAAYVRAKQSDMIQSKSRFITLRRPLGPKLCNPQYIIGNDSKGIMFVDGVSGAVSSKNPAFNN